MGVLSLLVLAASVYLVYVLEILKFRRLDAIRVRRLRPDATEDEIDDDVEQPAGDGRVRGGPGRDGRLPRGLSRRARERVRGRRRDVRRRRPRMGRRCGSYPARVVGRVGPKAPRAFDTRAVAQRPRPRWTVDCRR